MKSNKVLSGFFVVESRVLVRTLFFLGLYLYFALAFYSGGIEVPDRSNYVYFFNNPDLTRFEPLFKIWGQVLNGVGLEGFFSLFITATIAYCISFNVCSRLFNENSAFLAFFIFVFFAYFSIFSFVQVRASIAIWLGLYLLFNRHNMPRWLYVVLMCGVPLLHFATFPFAVVCLYSSFKRIGPFEFFLAVFTLSLLVAGEGLITEYIPNGRYYAQYFSGALRNQTLLSPMVISYFMMFFFSVYAGFYINKKFDMVERISFMGLPFVFLGYVTGVGLLIKFAAPFMFLTAYASFRTFFSSCGEGSRVIKFIVFIFLMSSIAYPFYKYA